jgi:hypothetical protein
MAGPKPDNSEKPWLFLAVTPLFQRDPDQADPSGHCELDSSRPALNETTGVVIADEQSNLGR